MPKAIKFILPAIIIMFQPCCFAHAQSSIEDPEQLESHNRFLIEALPELTAKRLLAELERQKAKAAGDIQAKFEKVDMLPALRQAERETNNALQSLRTSVQDATPAQKEQQMQQGFQHVYNGLDPNNKALYDWYVRQLGNPDPPKRKGIVWSGLLNQKNVDVAIEQERVEQAQYAAKMQAGAKLYDWVRNQVAIMGAKTPQLRAAKDMHDEALSALRNAEAEEGLQLQQRLRNIQYNLAEAINLAKVQQLSASSKSQQPIIHGNKQIAEHLGSVSW